MNGIFRDLRLSVRLGLGFAAVALVALAMAGVGFYSMQAIMGPATTISRKALPGIDRLRTFQAMQESMFTYSQGLLLEPAPDVADEYKASWKQNNADASAALDEYAKSYLAPANAPLIAEMQKAWGDLEAADANVVSMYDKFAQTHDDRYLVSAKKFANTTENDLYNHSVEVLAKMIDNERARTKETEAAAAAAQARGNVLLLGAALIGLALAAVLSWAITASVSRPLERVIARLTAGSEAVGSASCLVSSASQELANGTSEQAASIEETSSSLEEMASMTRANAENSRTADSKASGARSAAERGAASVTEMSAAIGRIKETSDATARIVKTIDEIAFQTNLLALNAAVEAARAGEAGRGFAVVAEEVRNLAQRSADAARSTSELIEGSQSSAVSGVAVSAQVAGSLQEIVSSVLEVSELVSRIAMASEEQARGIDQVNTAVAQMDSLTQANAANAEESASASEELSAQSRELSDMVRELVATVRGRGAARAL